MSIKPTAIPTSISRFRLIDGQGKWLHFSCETMVKGSAYAWSGTREQLKNARLKFPFARNLKAVADKVSPEVIL